MITEKIVRKYLTKLTDVINEFTDIEGATGEDQLEVTAAASALLCRRLSDEHGYDIESVFELFYDRMHDVSEIADRVLADNKSAS